MKLGRRPSFKLTSSMLEWQEDSKPRTWMVVELLEMSGEYSSCFFLFLMGRVFWTDLKNSEGEVEAQNLLGGEVARNVQRILPLLFQTNGGWSILDRFEEFCRSSELEGWWSRSQSCPKWGPLWGCLTFQLGILNIALARGRFCWKNKAF